jgi:hypothetical protein
MCPAIRGKRFLNTHSDIFVVEELIYVFECRVSFRRLWSRVSALLSVNERNDARMDVLKKGSDCFATWVAHILQPLQLIYRGPVNCIIYHLFSFFLFFFAFVTTLYCIFHRQNDYNLFSIISFNSHIHSLIQQLTVIMTSINSSPTKLKTCNGFLPQVKFPVYTFRVPIIDWPIKNAGIYFRDMDSLEPPKTSSDDIFVHEFIFRGIPTQHSSNSRCCYLLNPELYPPTEEGYNKFLQDLKSAAGTESYTTQNKRKDNKTSALKYASIGCTFSKTKDRRVQSKAKAVIDPKVFRVDKINNSRKCSRGSQGKSMPRRSYSQYGHLKCAFKGINLHVGKKCLFFIPSDNEELEHTNHPQFDLKDKKVHVSKDLKKIIATVAAGKPNGYNILKASQKLHPGGMNLSKGQANHHSRTMRYKAHASDEAVPDGHLNDSIGVSKLLQCFECRVLQLRFNDGYSHNPKSLQALGKTFLGPSPSLDDSFTKESITRMHSDTVSNDKIRDWVKSVSPHTKSDHAIAICWLSKEQHLLAKAFGHTFHIDATHKVCVIDNLLMLTITVRDRHGSTYVVGRFWIPNQRRWMFRYILFEAIPTLFGDTFCQNVRAIVSDGDIHLTTTIDDACRRTFPNAIRRPCSWHLSDRTINTAQSSWLLKGNVSKYVKEWFCRFLQKWLGTFMIPGHGVENKSEYVISKSLLIGVVNSGVIAKCFTSNTIQCINEFLLSKIFVHEHTYLAYEVKTLFNMEQHSNSAHEGTNNGIKNLGDGLHVRDSLVGATEKCGSYDRARFVERNFDVAKQYLFAADNFSGNFSEITRHIVGVLQNEQNKAGNYIADVDLQENDVHFYVLEKDPFWALDKTLDGGDGTSENNSSNLPEVVKGSDVTNKEVKKMSSKQLFGNMGHNEKQMIHKGESALSVARLLHVRKVSIQFKDGKAYLYCDCCMDERCGTICRHKFKVFAQYLKPIGFMDFNHQE